MASEVAPIRVIDLFAGCGGLSLGFESTGRFETVAAVEIDLHAAATYAANFGDHVHVGDIADWLKGPIPSADVIVGGPPCQGFSNLGLRNADDPRNALWQRYIEAVAIVKPGFFVIENVPQFLKSTQFEELAAATQPGEQLEDFELESWTLNAADFGAPQNRRRGIVIGRRRGTNPLGELTSSASPSNVRQAFKDISHEVSIKDLPVGVTHEFRGQVVPGPFKSPDLHVTRNVTQLSLDRYREIPEGGNRFDLPDHLKAPCWLKHNTGAGDVMGRLRWNSPSVTIRTEFFKPEKGRYLHPVADRPITHLEALTLQGFPDTFVWCGTKLTIARQIGNAVPFALARALGGHIAQAFDSLPCDAVSPRI